MARSQWPGGETASGTASEACSHSGGDHTFVDKIRGVYVSVAGNITGRLPGDAADSLWSNVPVGIFQLGFTIIRQTGTTATVQRGII